MKACRSSIFVLLGVFLAGWGVITVRGASLQQTMATVYITDVTDTSFVVSWITDVASDGHVDWGTTTSLGKTESDEVTNTTTHYVTITDLSPNTPYYFQVRSGTSTDDNGGAYYTVTTGSTLDEITPGSTIVGNVYKSDETSNAYYSIVYLQILNNDDFGHQVDSQWVTARAGPTGDYTIELLEVRTADSSAYYDFTYGGDNLRMVFQGGVFGTVGENPDDLLIYPVPSAFPWDRDMVLDDEPTVVGLTGVQVGSAPVHPGQVLGIAVALAGAVVVWLRRLNKDQAGKGRRS